MFLELGSIFFNVISPVFSLVLIGYVAGPRLGLEARTISRVAYFILVPSFVFNVISTARLEADVALRMVSFAVIVHLAVALVGGLVAFLLGRRGKLVGAYVLIAVFGNVGNFGLPIIEFHLGPDAIAAATVYFLAILVTSFIIGVLAANWHSGGSRTAVLAVFKTPALIALLPALLVNIIEFPVPIMVERITGLLGQAMVPMMLLTLGVQLAGTESLKIEFDSIAATAVRLLIAPALALLLVPFFDLGGIERGAGIFQTAMPAAVLTSIIALEYDLLPDFVTRTVLFSTLASVITLTLLLAIV